MDRRPLMGSRSPRPCICRKRTWTADLGGCLIESALVWVDLTSLLSRVRASSHCLPRLSFSPYKQTTVKPPSQNAPTFSLSGEMKVPTCGSGFHLRLFAVSWYQRYYSQTVKAWIKRGLIGVVGEFLWNVTLNGCSWLGMFEGGFVVSVARLLSYWCFVGNTWGFQWLLCSQKLHLLD